MVKQADKRFDWKQKSKQYGFYGIAPAVTVGLLLIVYAIYGLFPFSRNILAWGDMTQQSIPLLLDFKNILSGQFDMFLNTANAGGMDFWGVFLFFLSSPFSFLVAFVDTKDIYLFANILVLLKMAACAFTASLYFRKQFPRLTAAQSTALAVMYAFCGYGMMYYQNLVWFDMMYLFPLLLLGLWHLIKKGKIGMYVVTLTAAVAINYYLSYMVVVFLLLAMAVYTIVVAKRGTRRKTIALFLVGSFLAALLSAIFWMPSLLQYAHSARTTDLLTSLCSSDLFTSVTTAFPVILCTAAVIAGIPMFFLGKLYQKRENTGLFVLLILTLIPVVLEPINKMWHTGSYQAFPVRYGYITVFMGLSLVAAFLTRANTAHRLTPQKVHTAPSIGVIAAFHVAALAAVGLLLLLFQLDEISSYVGTLWMSTEGFLYFLLFAGLAALVYFMIFVLYHNMVMSRRVFTIVLCCFVACESFFCSNVFIGTASRSQWSYENALSLNAKTDPSDLFRTKLNRKYFDVNLVGALGYNTLSHYTSLTDETYMFAMKKLGYSSYWMEVGSNGGTLLTDMLLGNRYTIMKNTETTAQKKDKVYEGLIYCLLENDAVTSFGTVFSTENISALENLPDMSRMELQQYLSDVFYDCGEVITEYQPKKLTNLTWKEGLGKQVLNRKTDEISGYVDYTVEVEGTKTLYVDCFDNISTNLTEAVNDSLDVYVNGIRVETGYPTQKNNGLLKLGTFTDETVEVELKVKKDITAKSFGVYGVDETAVETANEGKTPTTLTRSGNTISGTATAQSDSDYLFLPMAWDSGYTVTVNGKEAELYEVFDTFMAVKLDKGENTIAVTYIPQGFLTGALLSGIGVVAFGVALWALRQKWIRRLRIFYKPLMVLFAIAVIVVFAVIYILPMAIYILF